MHTTSKNHTSFCLTPYKKWLVLLGLLVIVLIVWIAVGYDGDKTEKNMERMAHSSQAIEGQLSANNPIGFFNNVEHAHIARLQESYSDIASKIREVTVNISASSTGLGASANNGGLAFAEPFNNGANNFMANPNISNHPKAMGVNIVAPPILKNSKMPHNFRGVCTNCHTIIDNTKTQNIAAGNSNSASIGSGMIIDSDGYILTNYHIIANANNIIVTTATKNKYRATVKYTDTVGDLAILKISSPTRFPSAVLGDSTIIQEGDIVLAVGSPFGLSQTVTSGIISDTNRTVNIGGTNFEGLIQTDAAINKGSSGGPLVNIKGEVVGINTAIYSMTGDFTGIGFAIPINRAKETFMAVPSFGALNVNILDLNVGEVITVAVAADVSTAWFGAEVSDIDPIMAQQFGLHNNNGVLVNRVFTGSPAKKAGLKRNDIIIKINGRRINDIIKFQKITSVMSAGETINLKLVRNNKPLKVTALLEIRKQGQVQAQRRTVPAKGPLEFEWGGMEVVPITPALAVKYGILKGEKGVVVIEAEGIAAASGILMGDVIKGLNRDRINNMSDFVRATPNASIIDGVLLDVVRQGDPLYITM